MANSENKEKDEELDNGRLKKCETKASAHKARQVDLNARTYRRSARFQDNAPAFEASRFERRMLISTANLFNFYSPE